MSGQSNNVNVMLPKLEKLVKKVIRKSLKDSTLDYTVQITVSSLEPGKIKYAALISSPRQGIQPVTFILDSYETLEAALIEAQKQLNPSEVEKTFHQSRINTYKNSIKQHKERIKQIDKGEDPEDDSIEMEMVS